MVIQASEFTSLVFIHSLARNFRAEAAAGSACGPGLSAFAGTWIETRTTKCRCHRTRTHPLDES